MEPETILALRRLNRGFYEENSDAFDRSRSSPWTGWESLIEPLAAQLSKGWRGLEVGCGNGRFAAYLADRLPLPASYIGLDFSLPLLRQARRRLGTAPYRWLLADLADPALAVSGCQRGFELVAAIAVLHHLPSAELRREVVRRLSARLRHGGLLVLSFWDFSSRPAHRWAAAEAASVAPELAAARLEPNGVLLPWGERRSALRYCHLSTEAEQQGMLAQLPLEPVVTIEELGGPGARNVYRVLRRP